MPAEALPKVVNLQVSGSWADVQQELQQLVASGPPGRTLFTFAMRLVLSKTVNDTINASYLSLKQETTITAAKVILATQACMKTLSELEGIDEVCHTCKSHKCIMYTLCISLDGNIGHVLHQHILMRSRGTPLPHAMKLPLHMMSPTSESSKCSTVALH